MSETTNLKLFKHDNPATNDNQFNVKTALNDNWDKIDVAYEELNTSISNLEEDNETNKTKIEEIETKNTEQDTNIQKNTEDIEAIKNINFATKEYVDEIVGDIGTLVDDLNGEVI